MLGIGTYHIYVSNDSAPFVPFLLDATQTIAIFTGQVGQFFGFYSVATSNAANVQPTPAAAQATTTVNRVNRTSAGNNHVNHARRVNAPSLASVKLNATVSFCTANGNPLILGVVAADGGLKQLTLTVAHGALPWTSGLSFARGSDQSAAMVIMGTLASVNSDLNGFTYTPTKCFKGSAVLGISLDDFGNTGLGVAMTASVSVGIIVDGKGTRAKTFADAPA